MASPFHIFRRNQKLMLAILTLMAMFAFVFLDPLFRYLGSGQAPANPVVVETKYGDLKRSDIDYLKQTRGLVEQFLRRLANKTVEKLNDQGVLDLRSPGLRDFYSQQLQNQFIGRVMRSPRPTETRDVVDTMLLARRADGMNLKVSDATINALFDQLTNKSVTGADILEIIHGMGGGNGRHVTDSQIFDALRTELAASAMAQAFAINVNATPPGESWDYFKRLNQKATIEAIAVRASRFTEDVPDPGDEELKAFFDKYKDQFAIPGSPEPGFKVPRRQQFQYFMAEFDMLRETETATEEEIQKYYDENKEQFRKIELPKDKPGDGEDPSPATDEEKDAAEKDDAAKDTKAPADDTKAASEDQAPKADAPKTDTPKAEEPKSGDAPKPDGAAVERGGEKKGFKIRLVADEKQAADAGKTDAKEEQPAEEKPADDKPADEKPAEKELSEDKSEVSKSEDGKAADEKSAEDKPAAKPEYEPLEKVKEQIEREIKSQKARQKINDALQDLTSRLTAYSDARTIYDLKIKTDPTAKPPKGPDFEALAKEHGLEFGETKLVSFYELSSSKGLGSSRYGNVPFAYSVFRKSTPSPFTPMLSEDTDGNRYLSWMIKDEPEAVPTFEAAREQVLETWKLVKARDLARKQAETYAAEARGAKKPLSEVFTGDKGPKVFTAGPFSWLTLGTTADNAAGGVPMLSEISGIDSPTSEFMQTTFGLSEGEIGVALNGPQDVCYVIQVTQFDPPTKQLEEDFARENFRNYMNVAVGEKQQLMRSWLASVERDAGLKWLEEPSEEQQ